MVMAVGSGAWGLGLVWNLILFILLVSVVLIRMSDFHCRQISGKFASGMVLSAGMVLGVAGEVAGKFLWIASTVMHATAKNPTPL